MVKTDRIGRQYPAGNLADFGFLQFVLPVFGVDLPARRRVTGSAVDFHIRAVRVLCRQTGYKP